MGPGLCSALSEASALALAGVAAAFDGVGVEFCLSGEDADEAALGEGVC